MNKRHLEPPEVGRGRKYPSLEPQRGMALLTSRLWSSGA